MLFDIINNSLIVYNIVKPRRDADDETRRSQVSQNQQTVTTTTVTVFCLVNLVVFPTSFSTGSETIWGHSCSGYSQLVLHLWWPSKHLQNKRLQQNMIHERRAICNWMEKHVFVIALISSHDFSEMLFSLLPVLAGPRTFTRASAKAKPIPQGPPCLTLCLLVAYLRNVRSNTTCASFHGLFTPQAPPFAEP